MADAFPEVDAIIPFKNEAPLIDGKIFNLRALRYPAGRLRFFLIDGVSQDASFAIAQKAAEGDPRFIVRQVHGGKTAQLNYALRRATAPLVLVTDADSLLAPCSLMKMVKCMENPLLGAVSTRVFPSDTIHLEKLYWRGLDLVRRLEAARGCCSSLLAPAYLFRRSLVPRLLDNVVADDLFVSYSVLAQGLSLGLINSKTIECRSPSRLSEFLSHKFRKGHAYAQELFRFVHCIGSMNAAGRRVFLVRFSELIFVPFLLAACAVIITISYPAVSLCYAALAALMLFGNSPLLPRPARLAALFTLLVILSLGATLSVALSNQTSDFKKVT